jgi:phosphatidylglycerophosphatase C
MGRGCPTAHCDWTRPGALVYGIVNVQASVAVFDFDGTITRRDSTVAFCLAAVPAWRLAPAVAVRVPQLVGLGLGMVPRTRLKESLMTAFFRGVDEDRLRRRAAGWAVHELPRMVRPAALARMRWHMVQGHRVVLASASLEIFLEPWARAVGVRDVLATRLEVRDGRLTGRLAGPNCYGEEKVVRLQALLGDLDAFELHAYGDSRGDQELLAVAQHPAYRPFQHH